MAYQLYSNLAGPDDVLTKMRDFAVANGWTALENLTQDLALDGLGSYDGRRLTLKNGDIYANFRSANGKAIFATQNNATTDLAHGIGLVCSTNYTSTPPSGKWYDQPNATKHVNQEIIGVGIPVNAASNLNLYCNAISDPAVLLIFSLEITKGIFQHLAVAATQKVGAWTGGMIYSGSRNSINMFPSAWDAITIESESNHLFGMSAKASTFLRCDIDAAPLRLNSVLWASAGPDSTSLISGCTGKILATPVCNISTLNESWFPKIPHYGYLQSQDSKDVGRNANTLNCISVNLPIALYVQRDPDALRNYSQVGYVPGLDAISIRNAAAGQTYEISYPNSDNLYQVFPHVKRGGGFGYDGISIKQ